MSGKAAPRPAPRLFRKGHIETKVVNGVEVRWFVEDKPKIEQQPKAAK